MSRKGVGSFEVEMDKLKADNERLIQLLRTTNDYQDMADSEILKKASHTASSGKRGKSTDGTATAGRGASAQSGAMGGPNL